MVSVLFVKFQSNKGEKSLWYFSDLRWLGMCLDMLGIKLTYNKRHRYRPKGTRKPIIETLSLEGTCQLYSTNEFYSMSNAK